MPSPVSRTAISIPLSPRPTAMTIVPPSGVAWSAFSTRFSTACFSWKASASTVSGPSGDGQGERDPLARALRADEAGEVREQRTHRDRLQVRAGRPGEPQELAHEVVEASQLARDLPEHLEDVVLAVGQDVGELVLEDPEVDLQGVERVPDLVGDPRGERLDERDFVPRRVVRHPAVPVRLLGHGLTW